MQEVTKIKNNTDYADFFVVSMQDAKDQCEKTEEFLNIVEDFLNDNYHF